MTVFCSFLTKTTSALDTVLMPSSFDSKHVLVGIFRLKLTPEKSVESYQYDHHGEGSHIENGARLERFIVQRNAFCIVLSISSDIANSHNN